LAFQEIRDRAHVFADGVPIGTLEREHGDISIELPPTTTSVEILVEDEGRVNYGSRIGEAKGLIGPALLNGREVHGWSALALPFDDPSGLLANTSPEHVGEALGPVRASSTFSLEHAVDLHLSTSTLGKGAAWVNGWPLGRFWSRGPQQTLYVPGPVTR
jgi:beta-galactosidase